MDREPVCSSDVPEKHVQLMRRERSQVELGALVI